MRIRILFILYILFHQDKTAVEHFGLDRSLVRGIFEHAGLGSVTIDTASVVPRETDGVRTAFPVFMACGCASARHPLQ